MPKQPQLPDVDVTPEQAKQAAAVMEIAMRSQGRQDVPATVVIQWLRERAAQADTKPAKAKGSSGGAGSPSEPSATGAGS